MDFGRLPDIKDVDWTLPADAPENEATLKRLSQGRHLQAYIGLPILADPEYVGRMYPPGTKSKEYFRLYSQRFNTLEFNTTHYGIPRAETVDHWRNSVPDTFRYCPKVPQSISHSGNLATTYAERDAFIEVIQRLGPTLGPQFIQFPPQFGPDRLTELIEFLRDWPSEVALTVELREESWFEPGNESWNELTQALSEFGIGLVITDTAGRRDVLHMQLTVPSVLVRFNGYELDSTDYTRTKAWIQRLRKWQSLGLESLYFFQHQHHPHNSLALTKYMVEEWNKDGEPTLNVPRLQNPDAQQSLF